MHAWKTSRELLKRMHWRTTDLGGRPGWCSKDQSRKEKKILFAEFFERNTFSIPIKK